MTSADKIKFDEVISEKDIIKNVRIILSNLEESNNLEKLKEISESYVVLKKNEFKKDIYPIIDFNFTKEDKKKLSTYKSAFEDFNFELQNFSPLEKLLISFIWKQRDLGKVKYVLQGICDLKSDSGPILFQFGKHLCNPLEEPIIDNNVLSAYRIHINSDNKLHDLIDEYREWVKSKLKVITLEERVNYIYLLDKILFEVGKSIKTSKKTKRITNNK